MDYLEIISVAGLGGILGSFITTAFQYHWNHKSYVTSRNFEEKKEAYIGLLDSYHKAAIEPSDRASKEFAFWQMRCDLVAPSHVRAAIQNIVDTNENRDKRYIAHENLKEELRKDLSVSK